MSLEVWGCGRKDSGQAPLPPRLSPVKDPPVTLVLVPSSHGDRLGQRVGRGVIDVESRRCLPSSSVVGRDGVETGGVGRTSGTREPTGFIGCPFY